MSRMLFPHQPSQTVWQDTDYFLFAQGKTAVTENRRIMMN